MGSSGSFDPDKRSTAATSRGELEPPFSAWLTVTSSAANSRAPCIAVASWPAHEARRMVRTTNSAIEAEGQQRLVAGCRRTVGGAVRSLSAGVRRLRARRRKIRRGVLVRSGLPRAIGTLLLSYLEAIIRLARASAGEGSAGSAMRECIAILPPAGSIVWLIARERM